MSDSATLVGPPSTVRVSRAVIGIVLVIAVLAGIATLVAGLVDLIGTLSSGQVHVTLVADKGLPGLGAAWSSDATIHVVGGSYAAADLTLQTLPTGIFVVTVVSMTSLLLTQLALCALVAALAWRLLRGAVFRRSLAITTTAAGAVLAIGGLLSQASNAMGGALVASDLNGGGRGFWPLAGRFDPTLMAFGFTLLLVGLAFEYGNRLQKESEGLV